VLEQSGSHINTSAVKCARRRRSYSQSILCRILHIGGSFRHTHPPLTPNPTRPRTDLKQHGDEVVGVLGHPGLLGREPVPRGNVRIRVLEVLQVWILAVDIRVRVVPCAGTPTLPLHPLSLACL
jgi:hypothetical protein